MNNEAKVIQLFKQEVKAGISNEPQEPASRKFLEVLDEYTAKHIKEDSLRPATQEKYQYFVTNIRSYFIAINQEDITLGQIRIKTMEEMKEWLMINRTRSSLGHSSRHAEMCKRAMNYAVLMEYTLNNPLSALRAKRDKTKEVVHLEKEELALLINPNFDALYKYRTCTDLSARYHVADLYVFQCYTGLSYSDLYTYKTVERDGRLWIVNERAKNSTPYYVPMFPEAKKIHFKYDGRLPRVSLSKYNRLIKLVVKFVGIEKHISTHTARKTFATHRDNEGWSTKTIADMMGNTPEILQKHYFKKSARRIEAEMERLGF